MTLRGAVAEAELLDHLAHCRAVCFPAAQEDYGLVTVDAFACAKAVVTCTDSGGPAELVADGVNGRVVTPDPPALAAALGALMDDLSLAERLGAAARRQADAMTWDGALQHLLLV